MCRKLAGMGLRCGLSKGSARSQALLVGAPQASATEPANCPFTLPRHARLGNRRGVRGSLNWCRVPTRCKMDYLGLINGPTQDVADNL